MPLQKKSGGGGGKSGETAMLLGDGRFWSCGGGGGQKKCSLSPPFPDGYCPRKPRVEAAKRTVCPSIFL